MKKDQLHALKSSIPAGLRKAFSSGSGGVASLNHRLMADIPPGWMLVDSNRRSFYSGSLTVTNKSQVRSTLFPPGTPVFMGGLKVLTSMGCPIKPEAWPEHFWVSKSG